MFLFKGERDGPIYFLDSSKIPTPTSRYGGGGYHSKNYSGSITPLSCYSHQFEMMHLESLRDKLSRLSRDKGSLFVLFDVMKHLRMRYIVCFAVCFDEENHFIDFFFFSSFALVDLDDPYGAFSKQRSTDIGEGRITPTASSGE